LFVYVLALAEKVRKLARIKIAVLHRVDFEFIVFQVLGSELISFLGNTL